MGADLGGGISEAIFPKGIDGSPEGRQHGLGRNHTELVVNEHNVDGRVVVGTVVSADTLDDGRPASDGAQDKIAGPFLGDGVIPLIILLILEGDRDPISVEELWVVVGHLPAIAKESDVAQTEDLGAAILVLVARHFEVLAGAAGEEECPRAELADGSSQLRVGALAY